MKFEMTGANNTKILMKIISSQQVALIFKASENNKNIVILVIWALNIVSFENTLS